jgi:regulator of sirC expression with transglutaminase-like and TPR domain
MAEPMKFDAPTPLSYFAALVADDDNLLLIEAAASIAQDEFPAVDTQGVLAEIDLLADRLKRRIPADASPVQRLRLLGHYFFSELGFAGNVNDYYDPQNSYLHNVLKTRRGIPITLSLIYIELAKHIGLEARGVAFPGHFLVKLKMPAGDRYGEVVINPFTGQSLGREDLEDMLQPFRRRPGAHPDFEAPLGLYLQTAPPRDVLARLLRNLKEIYRNAQDWPRLLAVQQRLVTLLPSTWEERRDRGFAYAELSRFSEALADLEAYLEHGSALVDRAAVQRRAGELWQASRPRLH